MVVPGEVAVLGAGALASQGGLALVPALVVVIVGAIIGDNVGYAVGKRFGHGRKSGPLARVWSCDRMMRTLVFLDRHGGKTVFLARFVGFFRALVPFAAEAVRMPYRPFLGVQRGGGGGLGFRDDAGRILRRRHRDQPRRIGDVCRRGGRRRGARAPPGVPAIGACPPDPPRPSDPRARRQRRRVWWATGRSIWSTVARLTSSWAAMGGKHDEADRVPRGTPSRGKV